MLYIQPVVNNIDIIDQRFYMDILIFY